MAGIRGEDPTDVDAKTLKFSSSVGVCGIASEAATAAARYAT